MREGWTYKKLGDVCKVTMGQSPDGKSVNDSKGIEFHQGKVFFGEKYLNVSNSFTEQPSKIAEPNSVLLCVRAPVGIVNLTLRRICIGRGLCAIQPNDNIIMPFIYYALTTKQAYFDKNSTGSTFKAISSKIVTNTVIPVPPVAEQERIVAELDLLSSIIDKKKAQLKELDQLAQSIFYTMFGDISDTAFPVKCLNDVCEFIKDGTHQTPTYTDDKENGVKFLSAKDVVGGTINWDNIKYIPIDLHKELHKRIAPQRNDILLCKNGTTGICAIVETDEIFDIYVSLALLRPRKPYCPKYLLYAINNPLTKEQFNRSLKGVGVPNLHLGEIKKARIIYPPLSLQQEFAEKVEAIERQKALVQQSIAETQTLFDSRMDHWFS